MDWKGIMATVVGSIIIGSLMYLFTSIGESKHNDDIQNVHLSYGKVSDDKSWEFYDKDKAIEIQDLKDDVKYWRDEAQYWERKYYETK